MAEHPIERFTPHDFRRTARSNTKRLKVDFETAEAMMNHLRSGMERIYDGYELEEEKAAWFLKWEQEVAAIAKRAGVASKLGVPGEVPPPAGNSLSFRFSLPESTRIQPRLHLGSPEPGTAPKLAQPAAKFMLTGKALWPPLAKSVDLASRQTG